MTNSRKEKEKKIRESVEELHFACLGEAIRELEDSLEEEGDFKSPLYVANHLMKVAYEHSDRHTFEDNFCDICTSALVCTEDTFFDLLGDHFDAVEEAIAKHTVCKFSRSEEDKTLKGWLDGLTVNDVLGESTTDIYADYFVRARAEGKQPMTSRKFSQMLKSRFGLRLEERNTSDGTVHIYARR